MPKKNQKKIEKKIYLDYASATPVDTEVVKAMQPFWSLDFANPSGLHSQGVKAKNAVNDSRKKIAAILGAQPDEIIFTSGGTESDNLAILGIVEAAKKIIHKPHIVTTNIEHSAIKETCRALELKGIEVTHVPVEENGIVDPDAIRKAIKKNTVLVSVMYANNEIGTIEPLHEIAKMVRHFKKINDRSYDKNPYPFFHTDAAQAMNYLPITVAKLGVDLLSFNGSKIYGPKGIGALYKRRLVPFQSIMFGGNQEYGFRPGTENVPAIVGLAKALEIAEKIKDKESKRLVVVRDYFMKKITAVFPEIIINGDTINRLPNNVNISVPDFEGEFLVIELDAKGIAVSSKSACKSDDPEESYVIKAIRPAKSNSLNLIARSAEGGFRESIEEGSVRFSLGRATIKKDIDYTIKSLKEIFKKQKKWQS